MNETTAQLMDRAFAAACAHQATQRDKNRRDLSTLPVVDYDIDLSDIDTPGEFTIPDGMVLFFADHVRLAVFDADGEKSFEVEGQAMKLRGRAGLYYRLLF